MFLGESACSGVLSDDETEGCSALLYCYTLMACGHSSTVVYLSFFPLSALNLLGHHADRTATPVSIALGLLFPTLLWVQIQFHLDFPISHQEKQKDSLLSPIKEAALEEAAPLLGNGPLTAFGHCLVMRAERWKGGSNQNARTRWTVSDTFSPLAPVKGTGFQQGHFL